MKVLFCSSEVVPFAKTGGLADVAGTLPPALERLGVEVKIVLPRYRMVNPEKFKLIKINDKVSRAQAGKNIEVFFIENDKYFDRDGLYQDKGVDYPDNLERFVYYCRETISLMKDIGFVPEIVHCNDWQTALIPVYLKTLYRDDPVYKKIRTVFTIHNLGYQGLFAAKQFALTGLEKELFSVDALEFYGKINVLKGGLLFSDRITTVSPTYAREIQTAEFGCGLEGVLKKRRQDLYGILNGIDYAEWDPAANKALSANFGPENIEDKYKNKRELQNSCGLFENGKIPLCGMITRLADQKGLDIFAEKIDAFCRLPLQFVLLGTGDPKYHELFKRVQKKYNNTAIWLKFDPVLAYKIYAGADMFLMPSFYEPCGLGQIISLKSGTIPIVRKTGGLADTVMDYDALTGEGNGFVFGEYSAGALLEAVKRALGVYSDKPRWEKLMFSAMRCDFSWDQSAKKYFELYKAAAA